MTTPEYRLNCAQYVLYKDGKPVTAPADEVALALSVEDGTLHKHGKPETVHAWAAQTRAKLLAQARECSSQDAQMLQSMAADLVVLQGRFLLEDLNQCLSTSGAAGRLFARARAGTLGALDMFGNPVRRAEPATV